VGSHITYRVYMKLNKNIKIYVMVKILFVRMQYRVSIKSFPYYKHLSQENYNCNKRSTC